MKRKLLLYNEELDNNLVVDMPDSVPEFGIGTWVTARVPDPESSERSLKYEVEGQIIGIESKSTLDLNTGEENHMHIYTLHCPDLPDENGPIECLQEEILFYQLETNEFSAEYYGSDEEQNEEQQEGTDEGEAPIITEADVVASQERAAGTGGRDY